MAGGSKDSDKATPQGAFSSGDAPQPDGEADSVPPQSKPPAIPGVSFPPDAADPGGYQEVVLEDMAPLTPRSRPDSSYPPPLGQNEDHDAWTVSSMKRRSTVPPRRVDDVDRLKNMGGGRRRRRDDETIDPAIEDDGGALDLVNRSKPSQPMMKLDFVGEMEDLYALDDLTGALRVAELILGQDPHHEQARVCADNCRSRLIQLYRSKVGALDQVPVHAMDEAQVRWLGLDHRSGFLLSRIDSVSSVEEILDICGMPRLEALKSLADLLERGAIRMEK